MAYQTIDHQPVRSRIPRRRRRSLLEIVLLAGFVLCLAVGLVAVAVFFWLRTPPVTIDVDAKPALALQPERISAPLALMQLAGDPGGALASQALAAGYLDNAFAVAAYDLELSFSTRRTLLLQVARGFIEAERFAEATIALRAAQAMTVLTPELSPTERHQSLLAIGGLFLQIDAPGASRDILEQTLAAAAQTPGLLPAQRAEIFDAVRPLAQRAGSELLAAQAAEYARNPFLSPDGYLLPSQLEALFILPDPDPAVLQAVEQRHFAARLLAERIQLTGGIDIEPEQQALSIALVAEDVARGNVYRRALATEELTSSQRLGFLLEWRNWLALKARIARQGFGLTLVPEWENNALFILQDISTVHININTLVDAISNEIEDPIAQSQLRLEMLLDLAGYWALGLRPDGQAADLNERIRFVQDELARLAQPVALLVGYQPEADLPGFRLLMR